MSSMVVYTSVNNTPSDQRVTTYSTHIRLLTGLACMVLAIQVSIVVAPTNEYNDYRMNGHLYMHKGHDNTNAVDKRVAAI